MTQRVCVIGGATWDVFFTTTQADLIKDGRRDAKPVLAFPYGGKVDAADIMYGFGGGAANVAIGLANLGVRADIVTRIGQDCHGGAGPRSCGLCGQRGVGKLKYALKIV